MRMRLVISIFLLTFCLSAISQNKWRKAETDSMQDGRLLYDEGNYDLALPIFEKLYARHYNDDFLKFMYGGAALYSSNHHEIALKLLSEVYEKNKKAEDIEYDLAKANHYNYKFDEAARFIDLYLARKKIKPEMKPKAEQLKKYITYAQYFYAHPTGAKITNAGSVVNTINDEYVPVISADESMMLFTYKGVESKGGKQNIYGQPDPNGKYTEDVFQSVKVNDEWSKPVGIESINTNGNDAAIALSPDGTVLFTFNGNDDGHGDIYISYLNGQSWTSPVKLKGQVNSFSWEGSCSLSSDGKTLFFSSERGGGYGGRDIYRASFLADSTWGNVVNLGDSINSFYDDDAPFIHPDGVTLFYSTKGKNSMGDYDIFQAKMNPIDSTFSNVTNLGYPINTPDGDRYYVLSADGKTGYYSSEKGGGSGLDDIYTVDPGYVGTKPALYLVKGKITLDGVPVVAKIDVDVTNKNNKHFATITSNKNTGNYLITLPAGGVFKVTYSYKDFKPQTIDIDATTLSGYMEKDFDLEWNPKKPDTTTVVTPTVAVVKNDPPKNDNTKDTFEPRNQLQKKTKTFAEQYGNISAEGLEFKVQIAAYRLAENYKYDFLKPFGKIEKLMLTDGVTRFTIGGSFKTLNKAWEHNKKVINAGQNDAFVTAIYNGKRVFLEELMAMGIFK